MPRKFADDLRARRRKFSRKAEDLKDGAARLKAAHAKDPELLPTSDIEENAFRRAEEFKAKAIALSPAIRLEEISVFTYQKKKGNKSYLYWKSEWRGHNGKMKQAHIGPAQGEKGLSEDEALQKARKMKGDDLGINMDSAGYLREFMQTPLPSVLLAHTSYREPCLYASNAKKL